MKRLVAKKRSAFKRNTLYMLAILPTILSSAAVAEDVIWIGPDGGSFWDEMNWSPNLTPSLVNNLIINGTAGGQTVQFIFDETNNSLYGDDGGSLTVGSGVGLSSTLNTYLSLSSAGYNGLVYAPMIIGANGATGTFNYSENTPDRDFGTGLGTDAFILGSGIQSQGVTNILGSGKQIYHQNGSYSMLMPTKMAIAEDGARATMNVNGGSISISGEQYDYANDTYVFSVGAGAGSVGEVNILGGGKIGTSLGSFSIPLPLNQANVIGLDGGRGTLNISGALMGNDGNLMQSRVNFGRGLAVGSGAGSNGNINVTAGGLLSTMSGQDVNYDLPSLIQVGVDGGAGSVLVSGPGSRWEVSGFLYGLGDWDDFGTVGALQIGDSGTGVLTIADEGVVAIGRKKQLYGEYYDINADRNYYYRYYDFIAGGGNVYLATNLGSQGTLNIGAPSSQAAAKPGTLEADAIVFGSGQGTVLFNHTDNYYSFKPIFEGTGTIVQQSGSTILLSDSGNSFTGNTQVNGGVLAVEGSLGGTMSVNYGGTLAGAGTVGQTIIHAGGNIAPGMYGAGTAFNRNFNYNLLTSHMININGDFTMDAGSNYLLNISPTQSSLINVLGSASINYPSVVLLKQGDIYQIGSRWHILSTTNGLQGQFSPVVEDLPYLKFDYEYDQNNAYLILKRSEVDFCDPGMTPDECAVGDNIDNNGNKLIFLYNLIASQQSVLAASKALNQLSGEFYASTKTVTLEDSHFLRDAMNTRLMTPTPAENTMAWAHGFGSWARIDDVDGHTDGIKRNIGGIFMGIDKSLNDQWRMGVIAGYSRANIESDNKRSENNRDDYHLGGYVGGDFDAWKLRTGVGYTWHDFSTTRNVAFPGLVDHLRADYRGSTAQAFAEGSYQFKFGDATVIEPFVNVSYVYVTTNDFYEKGGEARLNGNKAHDDLFYSTIGLRGSHHFDLTNGKDLELWGTVGWRHAYGNDHFSQMDLHFPNTSRFRIEGAPIAKNTAMLAVGMETNLSPSVKMGLQYQGQIASKTQDHGGNIYLRWNF